MQRNSPKRSSRTRTKTTSPSGTGRDAAYMQQALDLARKGYGRTSPNPMVGAVLVRNNRVIARGWHQKAGGPHAEVAAIRQARSRRRSLEGATLYVTLEPCSTQGRTPPCTEAIVESGITRVVVGAIDPNPAHRGRGLARLRRARIVVDQGVLAEEAKQLNAAFNHWVVHRTPYVTAKAAMSLDGKIATEQGESKWITGPEARGVGMHLRRGADAVLVGIETVLADNPSLTVRLGNGRAAPGGQQPRRIILDSKARTPLESHVASDSHAARTLVVVTRSAPGARVSALRAKVDVLVAPGRGGRIDLQWLMEWLGRESVTALLVEGGGEVHGALFAGGLVHRVNFFYAPKIIGGRQSRKAVGGAGATTLRQATRLGNVVWERQGEDLWLQAEVRRNASCLPASSRKQGS